MPKDSFIKDFMNLNHSCSFLESGAQGCNRCELTVANTFWPFGFHFDHHFRILKCPLVVSELTKCRGSVRIKQIVGGTPGRHFKTPGEVVNSKTKFASLVGFVALLLKLILIHLCHSRHTSPEK